MTIEKVSQEEMLGNFQQRYAALIEENKQLADKIKQNEITALKLQGAIETLQYYSSEEDQVVSEDEVSTEE